MLLHLAFVIGCFLAGVLATRAAVGYRTRALVVVAVGLAALYFFVGALDVPRFSLGGREDAAAGSSDPGGAEGSSAGDARGEAPPTETEDLDALRAWAANVFGGAGRRGRGEELGRDEALPGISAADWASVAGWVLFATGLVAIVWRPVVGVYLIVFFALAGDSTLAPAYPFIKGLSSRESVLFVHDALVVSPLEVFLVATFASWGWRRRRAGDDHAHATARQLSVTAGPLALPAALFLLFVLAGLVRGLVDGGDAVIALWEARPLVHVVAVGVIAHVLLERRHHVTRLVWVVMVALAIEGVWGTLHTLGPAGAVAGAHRGSITDHAASIHINAVIVLCVVVWVHRGVGWRFRLGVPLLLPPMLFVYLASQRRAAFLTLGIACALLLVMLWRERPRLFRMLLPGLCLAGAVYLGAFWNSSSPLGLPARAVRSVVASDQASAKDQGSNAYRALENANIRQTMHAHPILGVGFGRPFDIVRPMPDISFAFEWWAYITHNSVLWIWLKMGAAGFVVLLVLVGTTLFTGARVIGSARDPDRRAVLAAATLYLVMHFVYAWVDMSWDTASMVLVGAFAGLVNRRAVASTRSLARACVDPKPALPPMPAGAR